MFLFKVAVSVVVVVVVVLVTRVCVCVQCSAVTLRCIRRPLSMYQQHLVKGSMARWNLDSTFLHMIVMMMDWMIIIIISSTGHLSAGIGCVYSIQQHRTKAVVCSE